MKKCLTYVTSFLAAISVIFTIVLTGSQIYDKFVIKKAVLKYHIDCTVIIDDQTITFFPLKEINFSLQKTIIDDASNTTKNISNMQYCKLILKNTGNSPIKYNDFYNSERLGIIFSDTVTPIGMYIDEKQTPQYINFKISKLINNQALFDFDTIEANDSVILGILFNNSFNDLRDGRMILRGRTEDFDKIKPLDSESGIILGDENSKIDYLISNWSIWLIIFLFLLVALLLVKEAIVTYKLSKI